MTTSAEGDVAPTSRIPRRCAALLPGYERTIS